MTAPDLPRSRQLGPGAWIVCEPGAFPAGEWARFECEPSAREMARWWSVDGLARVVVHGPDGREVARYLRGSLIEGAA